MRSSPASPRARHWAGCGCRRSGVELSWSGRTSPHSVPAIARSTPRLTCRSIPHSEVELTHAVACSVCYAGLRCAAYAAHCRLHGSASRRWMEAIALHASLMQVHSLTRSISSWACDTTQSSTYLGSTGLGRRSRHLETPCEQDAAGQIRTSTQSAFWPSTPQSVSEPCQCETQGIQDRRLIILVHHTAMGASIHPNAAELSLGPPSQTSHSQVQVQAQSPPNWQARPIIPPGNSVPPQPRAAGGGRRRAVP